MRKKLSKDELFFLKNQKKLQRQSNLRDQTFLYFIFSLQKITVNSFYVFTGNSLEASGGFGRGSLQHAPKPQPTLSTPTTLPGDDQRFPHVQL